MTRFWPEGEPISVLADETGTPVQFTWRGQTHVVQAVANRWRLDDAWWRARIWREYFKVTTRSGWMVIVFRDLQADAWYLQRLYD
jgi:cytolysin (calcineurin-like family phosphatase)